MNESKCTLMSTIIDDQIYIIGGYKGNGERSNAIEVFDD